MDEIDQDQPVAALTVGEKLRAAREAKKLTVEDIAAQTRIPTRHLESLEASEWDKLPAPTYTMGFAKSYAVAVGLDRSEIATDLRAEMGGVRAVTTFQPELFEPADPKRVMPKKLVFGALAALLLVALALSWFASRDRGDEAPATTLNEAAEAPPPLAPPVAADQVTITAIEPTWVSIKDGAVTLKQGEMAQGEAFLVPPGATAPVLSTAKPEALQIMVGTAAAPAIGAAGTKVEVSLRPADLLKIPDLVEPPVASRSTTTDRPAPRRTPRTAPTTTAPAPTIVTPPAPATTNSAG